MTNNQQATASCRIWHHDRENGLSANLVALDRFRVTLDLGPGELPPWIGFGRTIRMSLSGEGEVLADVPVTVARAFGSASTGMTIVAQLRVLTPREVGVLTRLLGFTLVPPVPPPSRKGLRRRKAPPRPLPPHERRAHDRFVVNMDLWVTHGESTHIMRVRDISRSGMLCEMPLNDDVDWAIEGSKLKMQLFPPDGAEPTTFRGRIVRVLPRTNRRLASFGVCFDDVAAQVLIGRLLRKLEAAA